MHLEDRQNALRRLRQALLRPEASGLSDGELVERFLARRDEAAFAALVRRHGPMVLGVCRRLLGHAQDAEDAFQATFLVLVRRAGAIRRRESVGSWLYGVAYRTSLEARGAAARRRSVEHQVATLPEPAVEPPSDASDLRLVLDEELNRLPSGYRAAVVLCDLEGCSRREAAGQLGIPEGTLSSRLATARRLLARRLTARGITLSAAALATGLGIETASGAVPVALVRTVVSTAVLWVRGDGAGLVSSEVLLLTERMLKTMQATRVKMMASIMLAMAALAFGAGVLWTGATAGPPDRGARDAVAVDTTRGAETGEPEAAEKSRDVWTLDFRTKVPRVVMTEGPSEGPRSTWYLCYEVINRTGAPRTAVLDFELLIPGDPSVHHDEVARDWLEIIQKVEDPKNPQKLKDSVAIAAEPIPSSTPGNVVPVAGVAVWNSLDVKADISECIVRIGGLSNAWSVNDGVAPPAIQRKTLELKFKRSGDRMVLDGAPQWVYLEAPLPTDRKLKADNKGRARGEGDVQVLPRDPDGPPEGKQPPPRAPRPPEKAVLSPSVESARQLLHQVEHDLDELNKMSREWHQERTRLAGEVQQLQEASQRLNPNQDADRRNAIQKRMQEVIQRITTNDAQETARKNATESMLEQLRTQARNLQELRRSQAPKQLEAEAQAAEIEKTRLALTRLDKQATSWQEERKQLQTVINAWRKLLEDSAPDESAERQQAKMTLMKELQRQLDTGEREDEVRQIDRRMLQERLKRLQRQAPDETSAPPPVREGALTQDGVVRQIGKDGLVQISLGTRAGIKVGDRVHLFRLEPERLYLGDADILSVGPDESVARQATVLSRERVQVGDKVAIVHR